VADLGIGITKACAVNERPNLQCLLAVLDSKRALACCRQATFTCGGKSAKPCRHFITNPVKAR
jgi:hypothetical protein